MVKPSYDSTKAKQLQKKNQNKYRTSSHVTIKLKS